MELLNAINTKLKDDVRFRIVLVLCGIVALVLREPEMFIYPRIWAEEATVFYAFARHNSIWNIFTTAHVGYLTLFNSIVSTVQSKWFSVENAAIVSTYMGFLVQIIPLYIIAFTTHKFWDSSFKKILCMLIITVVMAPELYINTTNSHFIFGLITFLIMMVSCDTLSRFQKYFFRVMLFLGGLTGPASIFFTPIFLLKAYREKSKEKYIQAGIISVCAIIQACVILYAIFFNNTYNRLSITDLKTTRYRFIIDNLTMMPHSHLFDGQLFSIDVIILFGVLVGCFYGYLLFRNIRNSEYLIALLSFIIVAVLSTFGSLHMGGGPRYAYIPTCIFLIVLASLVFEPKHNYVALCLLVLCLSVNTFYYTTNINDWAYKPSYPKWKTEVAKWRADSTYKPRIHPAFLQDDEWEVKL